MDKKIIVIENKQEETIGIEFNGNYYEREENERLSSFINRIPELREVFKSENIKVVKEKKYNKMINKESASNSLKEKVKAHKKAAVAALLMVTVAVTSTACALFERNNKNTAEATQVEQEENAYQEYTDNKELNDVLNKIAKLEDGEEIVKRLVSYYNFQKDFNNRMMKSENKDKNGNAIYLKAEEIAAVDAIANGTNIKVPLTLPANLVICNYLEAGIASTNSMYVSEQPTGFEKFIKDEETKKDYEKVAKAVQKVLADETGANKNCREVFKKLYKTPKTYPEVVSLLSYDGNLTTAGLERAIDGETVAKYQEKTKTNNAILNYVMNYIEEKEELQDNNKAMKLCLEAYEIMNEENIKVELKGREKFDASTTEKGLRVSKMNGTENATTSSNQTQKSTTTTKKEQVSKQEAIDRFGKDEVEKAEDEAREDTYVDTDGDGKEDTQIDEANKKEEEKEKALREEAKGYEIGHQVGRQDGFNGADYDASCTGSEAYKKGYKNGYAAGYENGKYQRKELEKEEIIEEEVIYEEQNVEEKAPEKKETKEQTQKETEEYTVDTEEEYIIDQTEERVYEETPSASANKEVKKVISVESDGVVYTSEIVNEAPKVRTYGAQL